jgi:hypothetical protein
LAAFQQSAPAHFGDLTQGALGGMTVKNVCRRDMQDLDVLRPYPFVTNNIARNAGRHVVMGSIDFHRHTY